MDEARILDSDKLQEFVVFVQVARNEHLKA